MGILTKVSSSESKCICLWFFSHTFYLHPPLHAPNSQKSIYCTQVSQPGSFWTCQGSCDCPDTWRRDGGGRGGRLWDLYLPSLGARWAQYGFRWENHALTILHRLHKFTEVEAVSFSFPYPMDTAKESSHCLWDPAFCHFLANGHG